MIIFFRIWICNGVNKTKNRIKNPVEYFVFFSSSAMMIETRKYPFYFMLNYDKIFLLFFRRIIVLLKKSRFPIWMNWKESLLMFIYIFEWYRSWFESFFILLTRFISRSVEFFCYSNDVINIHIRCWR